ncbi:MAG: hypothetical protein ACJ8GO_00040 [Ramlibacter sp.]|jgi:hypothetical protein
MSYTLPQSLPQSLPHESARSGIPAWLICGAAVAAVLAAMLFFSSTAFIVEQGRILSSDASLFITGADNAN